MRSAYRALAYIVAVEVVVQAAAIAFAFFGLGKWIDDGATLDKSTMESQPNFTGAIGFAIHGINGQMIIPLLALILLIVSFFAKIPDGSKWAGFVLLAVVVQVALGMFGHAVPALGPLHGLNAFILFAVAGYAASRVKSSVAPAPEPRLA